MNHIDRLDLSALMIMGLVNDFNVRLKNVKTEEDINKVRVLIQQLEPFVKGDDKHQYHLHYQKAIETVKFYEANRT